MAKKQATGDQQRATDQRGRGVLWRHADFMKLWTGQTVSLAGTGITTFALPYAAIAVLGARPEQLGLLRAVGWLPFVLLSLLVGIWVDRHRRLPIMVGANTVRTVLIALVPLLAFAGVLRMWQLYAIVLLVGVGTVFFELAYLSYLPSLVERGQLVEGNAKLGASESAADVAGPGLAGLLVQVLRAPTVLLLDAASYVVSVVSLLAIRRREAAPERSGDARGLGALRTDLRDGLRIVLDNVYLRALACEGFTYNFFLQFYEVLLLYYATRKLHMQPSTVGLILSCGSLGGLLGAVVAPRVIARLGFGPAFLWSTAVGCAAPILVPLAGGPRPLVTAVLAGAYFVLGVGVSISIIASISLRQSVTPHELLGRMNAAMRTSTYSAVPVGALVAGFLGGEGVLGPRLGLVVGGIGLFLPAVIILLSPIPRLRELAREEVTAET
jgi:Na+/melibiose symporter-like transporter